MTFIDGARVTKRRNGAENETLPGINNDGVVPS